MEVHAVSVKEAERLFAACIRNHRFREAWLLFHVFETTEGVKTSKEMAAAIRVWDIETKIRDHAEGVESSELKINLRIDPALLDHEYLQREAYGFIFVGVCCFLGSICHLIWGEVYKGITGGLFTLGVYSMFLNTRSRLESARCPEPLSLDDLKVFTHSAA